MNESNLPLDYSKTPFLPIQNSNKTKDVIERIASGHEITPTPSFGFKREEFSPNQVAEPQKSEDPTVNTFAVPLSTTVTSPTAGAFVKGTINVAGVATGDAVSSVDVNVGAALDGNADSHIKASIIGCSRFIPVINGELQLGRWQSPMLVELDGPRTRNLIFQFISQ